MKIRYSILLILLASTSGLFSQNIVQVTQDENDLIVEYNIAKPADYVYLYVSEDGGNSYRGPLKYVEGDVKNVKQGYNKTIRWQVLKECEKLNGSQIKFKLVFQVRERCPKETFFTLNAAYSIAPQLSFGFSIGQVKRVGWFASVMISPDVINGLDFKWMNPEMECDMDGYIDGYLPEYNGLQTSMRASAVLGFMIRLSGPLCLKIGAGYGIRQVLWETDNIKQIKNTGLSVQGIEASLGLQGNFKGLALSLEAVSTDFKTVEAKAGIGISIRKKTKIIVSN